MLTLHLVPSDSSVDPRASSRTDAANTRKARIFGLTSPIASCARTSRHPSQADSTSTKSLTHTRTHLRLVWAEDRSELLAPGCDEG